MFYLYYDRLEKRLLLVNEVLNDRHLEMLESNGVLEKLIVRSDMYIRQYKCSLDNKVETVPDKKTIRRIRNLPKPRQRKSALTRRRMSEAKMGEKNGMWGKPNTPEMKESKSKKLKKHYSIHKHGKEGYKDSHETRIMKSINNCNKGGWFWICNHFTKEERRCFGEIPVGWRRGRLRNYIHYTRKNQTP